MPKLTEKQKEFLKKHNMWNVKKDKSTLGMFEKGDFKDFFRRKEKLEEELARLPDDDTKRDLVSKLQAAEELAKNKKFKAAYKALDEVKLDARKEADDYVGSLSTTGLSDEITDWTLEGENLSKLVKQLESGQDKARSQFKDLGKPAPFDSAAAADKFLQDFQSSENLLRGQMDVVKDACTKVESYLGKNDPAAKLQDLGHQLSMLRKEKGANVEDLTLRVESAHISFIHSGKTLKAGDFQPGVNQLDSEIEKALAERKKEASFLANQVYWKERSVTVGKTMADVLKTGPIDRNRIEALWAIANDRAEKGGEADLDAAVKMLADLKSLLETAKSEVRAPEGGLAGIEEARKLHSARVLLDSNTDAAKAELKRIRDEFQPALPAALNQQALKLDGLIAPTEEKDPVKIETLAKSIAAETPKLEELAVAPRAERATWKENLSAFERQFSLLTGHPLKDDATTVKPLIDKIKEDLDKAKLDATAMKWTEATNAVKLLVPRCESAMQTADGLAHFNSIRQERAQRIATLPNGVIAQEQARKAVEATKKLLTDADLDKNAKKYADAIAKLNQIPDAVIKTKTLVQNAKNYSAELAKYEQRVTELGNFTGDARTAIAAGLTVFTDRVEKAKVETTKDYTKSMVLLDEAYVHYTSLKAKAEDAVAYKAALDKLEERFKVVEAHEGRIAIEEYYKRMEADESFANARRLAGEFHIGTKILKSTEAEYDDQIAIAVIGKSYKEKHKKAGEDIVELEKKGNKGKATEGIAEARRRITVAENAATAKDWPGALKAIEEAAASIAAAEKLLADDKALADLKDNGKLGAIATDFSGAFGVYQAMRSHVAGKDTGGAFTARLETATAPAQRAQQAAGTQPPNFELAKSELDAAIAICESTLLLVTKKGAYDTALPPLKTAHTSTLPGLNEDNCINGKITEIGQAITRAEDLAKTPTFDFDGAQREIAQAMVKVRNAEGDAKAYKSMKANKQTIKETLDYLKEAVRSAGLADEIKRLEDAQTSISNDVTAGKFSNAVDTAKATAEACPALKKLGADYEAVKNMRKTYLTDKLPDIEGDGKEAAASELAQAKALDAEVEKMLNAHIYGLVRKFVSEAYWIIDAGKKILEKAEQFDTLRKAADQKLKDTLPNRNPATEERHDALRDRYEAAVKIARKERNYTRATNMLNTIAGECDGLATDAQAYRDYEASRQKAGKKLGDAQKDKRADDVRPLLTQLQGRHADAVKIGNGGDYAGAKELLDKIFIGAEKALTAANEARDYATAAEDAKKPGVAINDVLAKAEELYKALMKKPEALYAFTTLSGINKTIEAARKDSTTDPEKARTTLVGVIDDCAKARLLMAPFEQLDAGFKGLEGDIETFLSSHEQRAFVKEAVEKLQQDIEAARRDARKSGDHAQAAKKLQTIDAAFLALKRVANAHIPYVALKADVEVELERMEKSDSRFAIVADIASARKDLGLAADKAVAHDHKAAMALLEKAMSTTVDALLKAKMHHENGAPTEAEVKKILTGKDGSKRLDAIVATLDPKAKRKVLDVAFEVRFECKLNRFASKADEGTNTLDTDKEKKAPDMRRFYDMMCDLPETHTKDNDSMQIFLVDALAEGSSYNSGLKRVAMREGDVATSGIYGIALPHEIDETEKGCELDKGEPITFFDWNTVHEVGHAVDDKLSFMKGKGRAYAEWTEHGKNVRPIAEAVAGKYNFDVAYVAMYMATGTAVATAEAALVGDTGNATKINALATARTEAAAAAKGIPLPKDCDPDEWERRRVACLAWVDSARAGKNPWQSASIAKSLAIDGVVYHEAYDSGTWVSYKLDARKQGVSGYQFRAPGEWFSELYAAYHTKKMKPSHPAYAWLQKL